MKAFLSLPAKLVLCLMLLVLGGCQRVDIRGQYVSDELIQKINHEKMNEEEVMGLIGSPTYIPEYTKETWYYIQRSVTKKAWFDPKVKEQRVIKVTFHKGIAKAELLIDLQNESIVVESSETKSVGTDQSGVQKFVKNIGRFNKSKDASKKKKDK
jgi:outer membrane protein assembly factor BamE (lipoprotein component of BamABCDE complex)